MKPRNIYTHNGIVIQIDNISNGIVYFAKYEAKMGDIGNWDNFRGFWRMPEAKFKKQLKDIL